MGQNIADERVFFVFLCHAFVLESYRGLRAVVDAVRQPKLGMSFCWAQGSD